MVEAGAHVVAGMDVSNIVEAVETVSRLELCPDGTCVIAMVNEAGNGSKPENVPSYVNESAYTEDITGRSNVGDTQGREQLNGLVREGDDGGELDKGGVENQAQARAGDGHA